jgi:hypothetical protein
MQIVGRISGSLASFWGSIPMTIQTARRRMFTLRENMLFSTQWTRSFN